MPTRRAIASGNWSSTSTWNGGVVPTNGDTVYSNGFTVTIDQNIDIGGSNNPLVSAGSFVSGQWYEITAVGSTNFTTIGATSNTIGGIFLSTGAGSGTGQARALATLTTATNTAAGATSGGGQFNMSAAYNMTCDLRAAATVCLNVTGSTNMNLSGLRIFGGSTIGGNGLSYAGSGTVTVDGCILTGGSSNGASISNASSGNVVVTNSTLTSGAAGVAHAIGNSSLGSVSITNSTITASSTSTVTINNASTGSITISNSNITGGNTNAHAIANVTTGTITASNCTFLGGNTGFAIQNTSSGTVICTGSTFTASAFSNAVKIDNTGADVRLSGDFLDHWSGWKAVSGAKWKLGTTPAAAQHRMPLAGTTDSYVTFYTADNSGFGLPAANHVRAGISYGGGAATGTCAVPAAGSVAFGVPIDNTTGTAILTQQNVLDALTAQGLTSTRAGYLDRLDATVSSRLAGSAYTTPPTASAITAAVWAAADKTGYSLTSAERSAIATAVEQSILNENDGQAILNAIVGAIGNTNVDQVALVAAIRSDLERSGGKIDSIPTTAAPTAAANASAVWSAVARTITGGAVDTLTNAPASVTPSDIWGYSSRTLTSASGPTAAQNASAVRTELAPELAKVSALNTDRLAQAATVEIVGTLIAQANS